MAIYELGKDALLALETTEFGAANVYERQDLQRLIKQQINIVAPDTMVIAEEFGDWEDSRRRVDLLAIDRDANLVVIELKRTETGGHMELQAIRYAAMISTMTMEQAVHAHELFLEAQGEDRSTAESRILDFLGWSEPNEDDFGNDVRIVLAAANFSRELTSAVMWLNDRRIDICCVRLRPYRLDSRLLVDVQPIIPLPEAANYQVRLKQKSERKRDDRRAHKSDWRRFDLTVAGEAFKRLGKRHLIYTTVRKILETTDTTPERVAETIKSRKRNVWLDVDTECNADEFAERVSALREERGGGCDLKRFFASDDDLFRRDGRTYAFTNQWGHPTLDAVNDLKAAFPKLGIEYEVSEAS